MPDGKALPSRILRVGAAPAGDERERVVAGLLASPARIEPKYFYDELGCALYGAICRLPEYYPTRTELAIFAAHRDAIAAAIAGTAQFVDLGAGDCAKARVWLPHVAPARYVAVDIAAAEIESALARLALDFPHIEMVGVVTDFTRGIAFGEALDARPATFFYAGSSIGNFTPDEAVAMLAALRRLALDRPGSGLLIGVDGKKERAVLDAAYDDPLGVTAAFNRNALLHLNRRFGFGFAIADYAHRGFYDEAAGRIEMHLEALRDHVVDLGGGARRRFSRGERIHTENSYKYSAAEFEALLAGAGYRDVQRWSDAAGGYFVFHAA